MESYQQAVQANTSRVGKAIAPTSPESLSGVVGQTLSHLHDLEIRLKNIADRIVPSDRLEKCNADVEVPNGLLNAANIMRNTSTRCLDILAVIDNNV